MTDAPSNPPACVATRARATQYVDGVLAAATRALMQDHLRACPACLDVFRRTLALARAARALPREPTPSLLAQRVRSEVSRRRAGTAARLAMDGSDSRRRALHVAAALGALIAALGIGFCAGRASSSPAALPTVEARRAVEEPKVPHRRLQPVAPEQPVAPAKPAEPAEPAAATEPRALEIPSIEAEPAGGPPRRSAR